MRVQFEAYAQSLPTCVNRDLIDKVCTPGTCYLTSVSTEAGSVPSYTEVSILCGSPVHCVSLRGAFKCSLNKDPTWDQFIHAILRLTVFRLLVFNSVIPVYHDHQLFRYFLRATLLFYLISWCMDFTVTFKAIVFKNLLFMNFDD